MIVTRAGQTFEVEPHVEGNGWDFWEHFATDWEPESFTVLDKYLTAESTFVDVGAWIGPLTLWASRLCARVIAVEPDPVARAELVRNTLTLPNVEVVAAAISDRDGVGALGSRGHTDEGEFGNSMSALDARSSVTVEVETLTPETLWARYQIEDVGLVKIDIEGGESRLVESASFLRRWPLLFSTHGPWMDSEDCDRVSAAFGIDGHAFASVLVAEGAGR